MRGVVLELNLTAGSTEEQEQRKNRVRTHNSVNLNLEPRMRCVPLGRVLHLLLVVVVIDFGSLVGVFVFKLERKTMKTLTSVLLLR